MSSPLSPLDFQVLLVLVEEPLYGYAIMKSVESQSGGRLDPEIGSLYRVLARLMDEGLIQEVPAPEATGTHPGRPRKYYHLTAEGRTAVSEEARRLDEALRIARDLDLLADAGS